jgi:hypothetical protein
MDYKGITSESPVQQELKAGPRGDGNWPGFEAAYRAISEACDRMGLAPSIRCGELHVSSMADLGSGHEERMKHRLHFLRIYGWA